MQVSQPLGASDVRTTEEIEMEGCQRRIVPLDDLDMEMIIANQVL